MARVAQALVQPAGSAKLSPQAPVLVLGHQYPSANFASSLIRSGVQGGVNTIVEPTDSTPSSSETNSSICSETSGPIGQPGRGQGERDVHLAGVDLDVVDQPQLDEIEPQLGVDHVGERLLHLVDGGHR